MDTRQIVQTLATAEFQSVLREVAGVRRNNNGWTIAETLDIDLTKVFAGFGLRMGPDAFKLFVSLLTGIYTVYEVHPIVYTIEHTTMLRVDRIACNPPDECYDCSHAADSCWPGWKPTEDLYRQIAK